MTLKLQHNLACYNTVIPLLLLALETAYYVKLSKPSNALKRIHSAHFKRLNIMQLKTSIFLFNSYGLEF